MMMSMTMPILATTMILATMTFAEPTLKVVYGDGERIPACTIVQSGFAGTPKEARC